MALPRALPNTYCQITLLAVLALILTFPALAAGPIIKSPNDDRQYESFTLANQLKVLIISDPDTDKAAAAMDVFVGSNSDPKDREGLAHFLEHMLFLGTEKYPEPGEYHAFVSAHGGSHNAYTAPERTNYFLNVDKDYLHEALDRFGQFFVAPLFTAKYVNQERQIVHSEYESKKKDDGWRALSAQKQAANPEHPFAKFSIGSVETLAHRPDDPVREDLLAFYEKHYSANLMALVVLGKEPLPTLKQWVTEIFSAVPNIDAKALEVDAPMFRPEQLPARLDIVPVKDQQALSLTFPLPSLREHYRSKPVRYIAYLLGHEGKGSLLSLLKAKSWSEGLSAGIGLSSDEEATFNVSIRLTREGLAHIDDIIAHVFEYLRLVADSGIKEWMYDEQHRLAEIDFRFQEKSDPTRYVSYVAKNLQIYPTADVLRGFYAMDEYDPELIRRFLARLTSDNVLVTVNAPGLETDAVTTHFDAPYKISALPETLVQSWRNAPVDAALALPDPNVFIPDNLALHDLQDVTAKPVLIKEKKGFELWFQQDAEFRVPRADFYFSVRSPLANNTPEHAVLTDLYVNLVSDQLGEFAYPAYLAGLEYSLYKHIRGVSVRISGYSDKQDVLLARIVDTMIEPDIEPSRFARIKDESLRSLKNAKMEPPYEQAMSEVVNLLLKPYWTEEQRIAALEPLKAEDLRAFVPELLKQVYIASLAHGNLHRDQGLALAVVLEDKLLRPATPVTVPRGQLVRLNDDKQYIRQLDVDHNDSALAFYFQGQDKNYSSRARFALLAQILKSPFFEDLRTEKQLGYVVFSSAMPLMEVPGLVFVVQSPKADPIALENHIEQFIQAYAGQLAAMSAEDFERQRHGLLSRILERDQKLQDRSDRYWRDIDVENTEFDTREQLAEAVATITRDELVNFYRSRLLGEHRKRLVVRSLGDAHMLAKQSKQSNAESDVESDDKLILNLHSFKEQREVFSG